MKRLLFMSITILISFSVFTQAKLELYKDMITTDNLRLRSPEYAGNKILTVLNKGTRVKIIGIESKQETIDGITSNWVTVEVQNGAKTKDGNPIKYAVVGRCFAGYLKETFPVFYIPNYENGNGTIIAQTEDNDYYILKRTHQQKLSLGELTNDFNIYKDINKNQVITRVTLDDSVNADIAQTEDNDYYILKRTHQQKLSLGELTNDFNIYKDINKNQVITRVTLDDSVNAEELWVVQAKKDLLHYVWLKVSYKGIQGFFYYSGAYYSDYYKKYIDGYSDPYQNNRWEILEKINTGSKEWTVRKMYQTLSVFSEIEVRDKPGLTGTAVIAKIPTSFQNGNGQGTIIVEAITEEYEDSYRNRWIRTTVGGKTGWVSGRYLSAERGGPTYYIPEDWISFDTGDAP